MRIVVISGTNRAGANTLRVATRLCERYDTIQGVEASLLDLSKLPTTLFSPDAYREKPPAFTPFAEAVLGADGLVVVTPEYNGGMPGALKLFIDMLPFPESFERRPVCFVGLSAGRWGALRPVEQLQAVFGYRNAHIFPERVFLPGIQNELGPDGMPTTPLLAKLLTQQIQGFVDYCAVLRRTDTTP